MQRLLNFLFRYRNFLAFLILEIICIVLIIQNNRYHSAAFFNSSNFLAASVLSTQSNINEYFGLRAKNELLAVENAELKAALERLKAADSVGVQTGQYSGDSTVQYNFTTAKVINNSTQWRNNTLTINKGLTEGIEPGMGVVGYGGVVGKVKYVSNRYAVITSLLHSGFTVSSRIKDKVEVCTSEWNGTDPGTINIRFVPRHHDIAIGDSVLTSGYNAVFPSDVMIGRITEIDLEPDANFYEIKAELVNDFTQLAYVQVVLNSFRVEKDSLETVPD